MKDKPANPAKPEACSRQEASQSSPLFSPGLQNCRFSHGFWQKREDLVGAAKRLSKTLVDHPGEAAALAAFFLGCTASLSSASSGFLSKARASILSLEPWVGLAAKEARRLSKQGVFQSSALGELALALPHYKQALGHFSRGEVPLGITRLSLGLTEARLFRRAWHGLKHLEDFPVTQRLLGGLAHSTCPPIRYATAWALGSVGEKARKKGGQLYR
jgi:hypothetical protein